MVITCWSVKGGSGATVVASSIALLLSLGHRPTTLIDLCGDSSASLGLADPHPCLPASAEQLWCPEFLHRSAVPVNDLLDLVVVDPSFRSTANTRSLHLHPPATGRHLVIDAGLEPPAWLRLASDHDVLVVRGCYLALRRASRLAHRPTDVVIVNEPGRALGRREVEVVCGGPVVADIGWDPAVARSIDAGLLAGRIPPALREPLRAIPWLG